MTFLLDHLPPHVHVVLSTRSDPQLPLARLRARGELVEIRAADLRFTVAEEADVPQRGRWASTSTSEDVAALEERTEGWIAALQLAALSMQGRRRRRGLRRRVRRATTATSSTTSSRRCSAANRTRCGRSSCDTGILDRLTGPLCDAVTGRERRQGDARDRSSGRTCSSSRSTTSAAGTGTTTCSPTSCRLISRRAARAWSRSCTDGPVSGTSAQGEWTEAVSHALAGRDVDRAAELVESALPALRGASGVARSAAGLRRSPTTSSGGGPCSASASPVRCWRAGELSGVEGRLDDAERQVMPVTGDDGATSSASG